MSNTADNAIQFSFDDNGRQPMPSESELQAIAAANPEAQAAGAPAATAAAAPAATTAEPAAAAATAEPAAQAAASAPAATEEPRVHKITVDGQELEVTEADLKAGHMRHRDYTQKTQRLAEQQRIWETERGQLSADLAAVDQLLRDRAALNAYMERAFPGQAAAAAPPAIDPSQPPTAEDVAAISRYNAEQARLAASSEIDAKLHEMQRQIQQQQAQVQHTKMSADIDAHIASTLDKFPTLKKFEYIADDLMGEAAIRLNALRIQRPTTFEDAKACLTEAAERRAAVMKSVADEDKKASAVAAAKLRSTSPEPAGGAAAKAAPGRKLTLNSSDQKALRDAALADLQAFAAANA